MNHLLSVKCGVCSEWQLNLKFITMERKLVYKRGPISLQNLKPALMKYQVVHLVYKTVFFTGSMEACQSWLADYGLGWAQFEILSYDSSRIESDSGDY